MSLRAPWPTHKFKAWPNKRSRTRTRRRSKQLYQAKKAKVQHQ